MKAKNIFRIFMVMGILLCFGACNDDFLKEDPKDEIYADNLFTNYDGFQNALNAMNNLVRRERHEPSGVSTERSAFWKMGTDAYWSNRNYSANRAFTYYGLYMQSSDSRIEGLFNWLYDVINSANMIISRAEDSSVDWQGDSEAEDESNKNLMLAHARLYRAWAYRHLTYSFGDVPLSLEEISGANYRTDWPRNSVAEIRAEMVKDFLFAEQHLPPDYNDPMILPNVIAQHYLAELYLAMGQDEQAEQKALAVANNQNFALITERFGVEKDLPGVPFMDQFKDGNALAINENTETLWAFISYPDVSADPDDETAEGDIRMRRTWVSNYHSLTTDDEWAWIQFGGRGIGRAAYTDWVESLYEPFDDRFSEHAIRKFYIKEEGGDTVYTKTNASHKERDDDWPSTRKWDWVHPDIAKVNGAPQYHSMPYVRLAETYLLLAEALMNQDKNAEAAEWINKVRRRSNASEIAPGDVTLDFILDERVRELLTEEERRHTLNRVGKLVERTLAHNPQSIDIAEHNTLFPIPQDFIDTNTDYINQNPGY